MIYRKLFHRLSTRIFLCLFTVVLTGCASLGRTTCNATSENSEECPPRKGTTADYLYPAPILTPLQSYEVPALPINLPTVDLTSETDNIFSRIRKGFSMPDINNDLVLEHQQRYLNQPDYLRRMVERGAPYLYHIVEEIDQRGMPMELALLPMVESAYNPMAHSPAKASGLWQFIPTTGKRYNLDQNWWKDERRDIIASTAAALEYLQEVYEMHGDWHLALASYNWGEGAVARAIAKNKALNLPTDYLNLSMPNETQNYVPKLQALKNIFSSPETLKELGIPRIPNRPYFTTVTKPVNIDVKLAAQFAGIPVHEFLALNPAHTRPVIVSDSPMVIPAEKYDHFVSNLEAHEQKQKPLSSWQSYTLRPGDRLEKIAPRFGMTVANLKAINGIHGRIRLKPGLTLLVPSNGGAKEIDPATMVAQPRFPSADLQPATRTYKVRKGDTLFSIAKRHGMSADELKRRNHLKNMKIKPGTTLVVLATEQKASKPAPQKGKSSASAKKSRHPASSQKQNAKKAPTPRKNAAQASKPAKRKK